MDLVFYAIDEQPCLTVLVDQVSADEVRARALLAHGRFAGQTGYIWFARDAVEHFLADLEAFVPRHEGEAALACYDPPEGFALRIHPEGLRRRAILEVTIQSAPHPDYVHGEVHALVQLGIEVAPSHWDELVASVQRVLTAPHGVYPIPVDRLIRLMTN